MKKMAFLLAMILVVALTVVPVSASGSAAGGGGASSGVTGGTATTGPTDTTSVPTVNADKSGKFTLEEEGLTAGEWYGMLVLAPGAELATLTSSDILYIDQVKADENGKISFGSFGLLGGATAGDVFIGGKGLEDGAKNIATLAAYEAPVLTGINLDKTTATAKKSETVELTATFVPAGAEGTLTWVSSDATVAKVAADPTDPKKATVTVSGEAIEGATATITVFVDADADDALDDGEISATCTITVTNALAGDVNGDGEIMPNDATLILRWIAGHDVTVDENVADTNKDGEVMPNDATLILRWIAGHDVTLK